MKSILIRWKIETLKITDYRRNSPWKLHDLNLLTKKVNENTISSARNYSSEFSNFSCVKKKDLMELTVIYLTQIFEEIFVKKFKFLSCTAWIYLKYAELPLECMIYDFLYSLKMWCRRH